MATPVIEFRVFDRGSGAQLTTLPNASGRQCQSIHNDVGSGAVTLGIADADLVHMVEGNIVRCYVDGTAAFAWVVGPMDQATITSEAEATEERRIVGRGTLGLWSDGIVYPETLVTSIGFPWAPLEDRRATDTRRFDYGAANYDVTSWGNAVIVPPPPALVPLDGTPSGWPLDSQDWIWSRARDGAGNHPVGYSYFRHNFAAPSYTRAAIYVTADNGCELFLDGQLILSEMRTPFLWAESRSIQVELTAATHFLAVRGVNINPDGPANPAGIALVVVALDSAGNPTEVLTSTGSAGWKCVDYPAEPPGMTVGMILFKLWQEARTRGALTDLSLGFTTSHDTAGTPWPNAPDVVFNVGDDMLTVIRKQSEIHCDVAMDPASLTLNSWVRRGTDRSGTVQFTADGNITGLSHRGGEQFRTSAILARYGDHWLERSGAGRRQEKFLELGSAASSAQAERMIEAAIAERELPIVTTAVSFEPTAGVVPWVNFREGDDVTVPDKSMVPVSGRVKSISLSETDTDYEFAAEIGNVESEFLDRLQRLARKATAGALDGNFHNAAAGALANGTPTGAQLVSDTPILPLNALSDVVSVPSAPMEDGDYLGWNPELGTNGMWGPRTPENVGVGSVGTFLVTDSLGSGTRWTSQSEILVSGGNIGIGGGVSGTHRLAVTGSVQITGGGQLNFGSGAGNGAILTVAGGQLNIRSGSSGLHFDNNAGSANLMRMLNDGRFGIGGVPAYLLDVFGEARITDALILPSTTVSYPLYVGSGNDVVRVGKAYTYRGMEIYRDHGGSLNFRPAAFASTSSVVSIIGPAAVSGWGQAVAEFRGHSDGTARVFVYNDLDVNGAYGDTDPDGDGNPASRYILLDVGFGDVKAQNYLPSSDPALKANMRDAGHCLPDVRKLRPRLKRWNWKGGRQDEAIGLSAPEVAEAVPALAYVDAEGKPTAWKMVDAVAMLIGGLSELADEVDALKGAMK